MHPKEMDRRLRERRERRVQQILHRYSTRDLVPRYDGAVAPADRDRHLHGFNSPFAPSSSSPAPLARRESTCNGTVVTSYTTIWSGTRRSSSSVKGAWIAKGERRKVPSMYTSCFAAGPTRSESLHVMVNRFRWHRVLPANRSALEALPGEGGEAYAAPELMNRIALDLRPPPR